LGGLGDWLLGLVAAVAVAVVLALVGLAVGGSADRRPAASPPASPPAPYRLTLSADGRGVDLAGLIEFGITRALAKLLEGAGSVRTIRLESEGGRVAEARGLVGLIERHGLATSARGRCASACALVFMAGRERRLEPGAELGFHRYGQRSPLVGHFLDTVAEQDRDMALFRRQGVTEAFIERVGATPHEEMWFPAPEELIAAGAVHAIGPSR
jgi:hypothetical protein